MDKAKSNSKNPDKMPSTKSKKKKSPSQVTPAMGRTRGPHPPSPSGQAILKLVSELPRDGYLARNPTGYIFLDLDDDLGTRSLHNLLDLKQLELTSLW